MDLERGEVINKERREILVIDIIHIQKFKNGRLPCTIYIIKENFQLPMWDNSNIPPTHVQNWISEAWNLWNWTSTDGPQSELNLGSNTILAIDLTHAQKLVQKWMIVTYYIYYLCVSYMCIVLFYIYESYIYFLLHVSVNWTVHVVFCYRISNRRDCGGD